MKKIVFFDTEVTVDSKQLYDIGAIKDDGRELRTASRSDFCSFVLVSDYICGHNIFRHDLNYIIDDLNSLNRKFTYIDTLVLSPLLFPTKPYHKLLKDDKLQTESLNNPLNDAKKAKDLFYDEVTAFHSLTTPLQRIFCFLLYSKPEFNGFFRFLNEKPINRIDDYIRAVFSGKICANTNLISLIKNFPIELAYCLSQINANDKYSIIPGWVTTNYPQIYYVMNCLRNTPCKRGCDYCRNNIALRDSLKRIFGYDQFRSYNGEPLQEKAAEAAVNRKSLLAVFPTGGGKSLTFQLPAIIAGETAKGLTVVISPLQSLMKDQVDNLEKKGIVDAVAINGLLNPLERSEAIERVADGRASILYISPESLRSATIEKIISARNVVRFVIDEAHCFSAWGQDFRVDYLYIGDFIHSLQTKKGLKTPIPVSCFTATAKQKVISDIRDYFRKKLGVELELYATNATRKNLRYQVLFKENEEEKYITLRNLIQAKNCPTIVYVSRIRRTTTLAERLSKDGLYALPFNGKMDPDEKIRNQESFMKGETNVIVATSAFGMGVNKDNVGLVIHYDLSGSLEDYVQEAGRAGRDENITADCYVLFNDNDLDEHFAFLNQTKLSTSEINQVWHAIKEFTRQRAQFTQTPLEIARKAGWDDSSPEIETRVKTAIAALENAGYIRRGKNVPRVYASGIIPQNMTTAAELIASSEQLQSDDEKESAKRIMSFLISRRSNARAKTDDAESRVDYIADRLGLPTQTVVDIVNKLREEKILADSLDLTAVIHADEKKKSMNTAITSLKKAAAVENAIISILPQETASFYYKEVNEAINEALNNPVIVNYVPIIKTILIHWIKSGIIKRLPGGDSKRFTVEQLVSKEKQLKEYNRKIELAKFIIGYLFNKPAPSENSGLVNFSVLELEEAYRNADSLITRASDITGKDIEKAILYLTDMHILQIEGGFLVLYNALQVQRLERNNRIQYKKEDYRQLNEFYTQRIQQVHIIGEYAHMMVENQKAAAEYVQDYFQMDYMLFLRKYFRGREEQINRAITSGKHNKLFGELSATQRQIIDDSESRHIVVAAGPGSGKTRVLVHKLASLLLLEDVKSEQLLMLTFSRSAAIEFKQRLIDLIGEAAFYVEIKTFHSFAFDLLGRTGTAEALEEAVKNASELIMSGAADENLITKTVLVIDEAQDMDANEYGLVQALISRNDDLRIIAVGDDDQNIYEFRGSDSGYMMRLIEDYPDFTTRQFELLENYRSSKKIVALANAFAESIEKRIKTQPIQPVRKEDGTVIITKESSDNLEIAILNNLRKTYHEGSCCVLTATNEQALKITGLLNQNGFHTRLIQSSDGFNLFNLKEIRDFLALLGDAEKLPTISQEKWDSAVNEFTQKYGGSSCFPECKTLLQNFDTTTKTKYISDFIEYVNESKYEDFIQVNNDTILVSTIHKAKGREFDSVYLMLDRYKIKGDEERHAVFVALTRAKKELFIHCNTGIFDSYNIPGIEKRFERAIYQEPDSITLQLSYKDVFLDYFKDKQNIISELTSGSDLIADGDFLEVKRGKYNYKVVKFSKACLQTMNLLRQKGYKITGASVRFVVFWKNKNSTDDTENLILLPDIFMKK